MLELFKKYEILLHIIHIFNGNPGQIDLTQFECLADNVFFEARGESDQGQLAVAHVTLNRVYHYKFPNNICSVVYQPKQFSWTRYNKKIKSRQIPQYERAAINAYMALTNYYLDPTNGAKYFYNPRVVAPRWAYNRNIEPIPYYPNGIIGNHRFLRESG